MTTIALTLINPLPLSNLTAVGNTAGTGISLNWIKPNDGLAYETEVWYSTSNDRNAATLLTTVTGSNYLWSSASYGITYYFWVRSKVQTVFSTYFPVSSTAGISGIAQKIVTQDIQTNAISKLTKANIASALSINITTPTTYDLFSKVYSTDSISVKCDFDFMMTFNPGTALTALNNGTDWTMISSNGVTAYTKVLYSTITLTVNGTNATSSSPIFDASHVGRRLLFQVGNTAYSTTINAFNSNTGVQLGDFYPSTLVSNDWYIVVNVLTIPVPQKNHTNIKLYKDASGTPYSHFYLSKTSLEFTPSNDKVYYLKTQIITQGTGMSLVGGSGMTATVSSREIRVLETFV